MLQNSVCLNSSYNWHRDGCVWWVKLWSGRRWPHPWGIGAQEREREIWIFLLSVGQKSRKTWKPRKGGWRTGSARGRAGEQHGPSHQMRLRSEGAPGALFKARQTCCWIFCFLTPAWDAAHCCGSCMEKPQTVEQPFSATLFPVWRAFFFPWWFQIFKVLE